MLKNNEKGFTLIEVMISMAVMAIGMLAMSMMQTKTISGNSNAFARAVANNIAGTFIEELARIQFSDANLTAGGGNLDAGKPASLAVDPNPAAADHSLSTAGFPSLVNLFTINGDTVTDQTGNRYEIFWNVQNVTETIGTDTYTSSCTIRLFVYWNSKDGSGARKELIMTTVKYNNVDINA